MVELAFDKAMGPAIWNTGQYYITWVQFSLDEERGKINLRKIVLLQDLFLGNLV